MRHEHKAILNPDGISVKRCTKIYAPQGQAGEYAALTANPYRGCGHICNYCYVPHVTKQDRRSSTRAPFPEKIF
jgi:DNA repair photolyase